MLNSSLAASNKAARSFLTSKSAEFWYERLMINILSIHFSSFFLYCEIQISLGIIHHRTVIDGREHIAQLILIG